MSGRYQWPRLSLRAIADRWKGCPGQQTGHTYRLPSETEWEYACRAGTETPFHFGPTISSDLANYNAASIRYGWGPKGINRQETNEVGYFQVANGFGLCDLHGNVNEWCLDHWHTNFVAVPTDGRPWINARVQWPRVLRGGSYRSEPAHCRSAFRISNPVMMDRAPNIGFRVVCEAATGR
mgnify:CR=1 FL=1